MKKFIVYVISFLLIIEPRLLSGISLSFFSSGSIVYAQSSCSPPRCSVPEGYPVTPQLDVSIGYCTLPIVQGYNNCPSPYIYSGFYRTCIAYPLCDGLCMWDNQKKTCVEINLTPPSSDNGTNNGTGGGEFFFNETQPLCARDINGDGDIDLTEIGQCVNATMANGTQYELCPLDAVECNLDTKPGKCPDRTTLDPATDLCVADPQINCPDGYTYLSDLDKCVTSAQCPAGGFLNTNTDKCEITLSSQNCPSGFIYDSTNHVCYKTVSCPPPGYYNPSTDRCEASIVYTCPSGTTYNSSSGKCEANPSCPSGWTYSTSANKCVKSATLSCPSGFTYNSSTGKCEKDPTCPSPGSYNTSTNRCEAGAIVNCPSGGTYNPSTGKCEAQGGVSCPSGSTYNPSTGKCETNPTYINDIKQVIRHVSYTHGYKPPGSEGNYPISICEDGTNMVWQMGWCVSDLDQYLGYRGCYSNTWTITILQPQAIGYAGLDILGGNDIAYFYINDVLYHSAGKCCGCGKDLTSVFRNMPPGTTVTLKITGCDNSGCCSGLYAKFRFTLASGAATCPSGFTYNPSTRKCEANPSYQCPSGYTYNPSTGKCEASAQLSCPSGYTLSGQICIANAQCPSGSSLNTVTDKCETSVVYQCPSGSSYDSSIGMCVMDPTCPSGTSLNGYTDKCEAYPSTSCPSGYIKSGNLCYTSPVCGSGSSFNPTRDRCEISAAQLCPSPYTYVSGTNICQANPQCPQGSLYSVAIDKCVIDPNYNCPIGSYYNPDARRCEAYIECEPGYSYDPNINQCQGGNWTCPWGPERPCVLYGGKYMCSPHDCAIPQDTDEPDEPPSGLEDDAGYDEGGNCLGTIYIFSGTKMRCRPSGVSTGFKNCCDEARGKLYDTTGSFPGLTALSLVKDVYNLIKTVQIVNSLKNSVIIAVIPEETLMGTVYTVTYLPLDQISQTSAIKSVVLSGTLKDSFLKGMEYASTYTGPGGPVLTGKPVFTDASANTMLGHYAVAELGFAVLSTLISMAIQDPIISSAVNLALYSALVYMNVLAFNPVTFAMLVASFIMSFFMGSCDEQDVLTSTLKESGYCHYVGSRCIKKLPLVGCVQRSEVYCCFNSKLARIIHEQGRPQLSTFGPSGGWGSAKRPNCRGFTPEEFQAIDFGRIDFSEYVEDIQRNLNQNVQQQMMQLFNQTMQYITPSPQP